MAQRLKDLYLTRESIGSLAETLKTAAPAFDRDGFLRDVFDHQWKTLELKGRMHRVAQCLGSHLPLPYPQALKVLEKIAPSVHGFEAMALPDFVETYGLDDPEHSLLALGLFTRFGSSEFAIRPFLIRYPEKALTAMHRWAKDPDPRVRRLASEGCRPRLPWAMALPVFKQDPAPVLAILEQLKNDPSEDVRRSVANNLNDVARDNPDAVLRVCARWRGISSETDALLRHACRGLLKRGNRKALKLFGFDHKTSARVSRLNLDRARVPIGGRVSATFALSVGGKGQQKIRLEYAVDFAKKAGKTSRKVFKLSERWYEPGKYTVKKNHSFKNLSTRKHYPGPHRFSVIVNGRENAAAKFIVTASSRP
jgi:3-methyladenine DNA glycosylase AlkC